MTSDNVAINSTNFNVDKNGNCTANSFTSNNATITGGKVSLIGASSGQNSTFEIVNSTQYEPGIFSGVSIYKDDIVMTGENVAVSLNGQGSTQGSAYMYVNEAGGRLSISGGGGYVTIGRRNC